MMHFKHDVLEIMRSDSGKLFAIIYKDIDNDEKICLDLYNIENHLAPVKLWTFDDFTGFQKIKFILNDTIIQGFGFDNDDFDEDNEEEEFNPNPWIYYIDVATGTHKKTHYFTNYVNNMDIYSLTDDIIIDFKQHTNHGYCFIVYKQVKNGPEIVCKEISIISIPNGDMQSCKNYNIIGLYINQKTSKYIIIYNKGHNTYHYLKINDNFAVTTTRTKRKADEAEAEEDVSFINNIALMPELPKVDGNKYRLIDNQLFVVKIFD